MPRVLIAGHLDPQLPPPLGFSGDRTETPPGHYSRPLRQLGEGFASAAPGWQVDVVPFGPGHIFTGELSHLGATHLPTDQVGGNAPTVSLPTADPLLIEMGHDRGHDWGQRIWEAQDADELRRRDIIVAYSTSRPLYGAGGTSNTDQQLQLRTDVKEPSDWRETLAALQTQGVEALTIGSDQSTQTGPGARPGSGAGGGAAAWLMSLGARAYPTGEVLFHYLSMEEKLAAADLIVVASPHWHSPDLTDSVPLHLTEYANTVGATPWVGVGFASSLSPHEQAQWGLQGVHLVGEDHSFQTLGRRVGQTWGRL